MSTVQESFDVEVPIREAYDQWTQFETFPAFMQGVKSVTQVDDTHLHWDVSIVGQKREFDTVITEQHPDERIAWKSTGGDVQHAGVVTFHRLNDDQTRITVQLEWEPSTVAEKVGSAVQADTIQIKTDATRFKEFVEARGRATGGWRGDVPRPAG
ncbi:SRPBCC family protein [Fodinicola acaciae]|uniref:SRPBCC family protein n=1 Tax=Fodinicola acaciae TaxID=2681555 RepID=UPI001C9E3BFF|nr:SRPBCC family protein [Fodinicola acaciae]